MRDSDISALMQSFEGPRRLDNKKVARKRPDVDEPGGLTLLYCFNNLNVFQVYVRKQLEVTGKFRTVTPQSTISIFNSFITCLTINFFFNLVLKSYASIWKKLPPAISSMQSACMSSNTLPLMMQLRSSNRLWSDKVAT